MAETHEAVVTACVTELGFDLEAVELSSGGKRRVLRVAIDADGGVGIDDITAATRALSERARRRRRRHGLGPVHARGHLAWRRPPAHRTAPLAPQRGPRRARSTDRGRVGGRVKSAVTEGRIGASDDSGADLITKAGTRRIDYADIESAVIQAELIKPASTGKDR